MLIRPGLALLTMAIFLSACNLRRPEVTLTLAPIDTRTPVATDVEELPTETKVALTSPTPTPTGNANTYAYDNTLVHRYLLADAHRHTDCDRH